MPQREDGACIHLAEDNSCKIYESRPDICNVKKMYESRKEKLKCTEKEYYKISNLACNTMIEEYGLDDRYLIDVSKYDEK